MEQQPVRNKLTTLSGRLIGMKMATRPVASSPSQRDKRRRGREPRSRYEFVVNQAERKAEIKLFGRIGASFFSDGMSAADFTEQLDAIADFDEIVLRINSGGGDVFDATTIFNSLLDVEGNLIVKVQGVAASAATLVAMAGDEIRMAENAHWMIHAASGGIFGNAAEMREFARLLDQVDRNIRLTYAAKTGLSDNELKRMMAKDNWMTADEALEFGFIDAIDSAERVQPDREPNATAETVYLAPERLPDAAVEIERFTRIAAELRSTPPPAAEPKPPVKENPMNEELRRLCIAAGMDESLDDAAAQEWLSKNFHLLNANPDPPPTPPADPPAASADAILAEVERRRIAAQAEFDQELEALLALAGIENESTRGQCARLFNASDVPGSIRAVRDKIKEIKASGAADNVPPNPLVNVHENNAANVARSAIGTALQVRCLRNTGVDEAGIERSIPSENRPSGWQNWMPVRLIDICAELLRAEGRYMPGLAPQQIAQIAMGFDPGGIVAASGGGAALHTTGSLSLITQDAVNKSLLTGYQEAPATWRGPGRQAESVADFKTIHRIKFSAAPNLPLWPDNTVPEVVKTANEEETYAVEAYAEEVNYSWRMFVNDDLSAISRTPFMLGAAASRTVNKSFWTHITSNPTLADGQALFLETPAGNRKRSNLISAAASPTVATVGAMRTLMRLMRGLNTPEAAESDDILNISPRFIVGPAALENTILQLVRSTADPSQANPAVTNIFSGGVLTPVIEPLLDVNSATAWYLFADPTNSVDTVEVTFLAGQETPQTNFFVDERTMSRNYTIVQTFGCKAIDHRGMVKHDGSG